MSITKISTFTLTFDQTIEIFSSKKMSEEYISSISSKIYSNNARYQCYQSIDINDVKIYSHKVQSSNNYFLNGYT